MDNLQLKQTVETAQTGDNDALETLYREYAKPVGGVCQYETIIMRYFVFSV